MGSDEVNNPDAALVWAARAGDVTALGLLLERHRPGMRAVALSVLGPGPDAEDAVQEAVVVALSRIGDLRDPASAGPWLRMIVRNICRGLLRAPRAEALPGHEQPSAVPGPEELVDRHALRDWVWEAIETLSPALRLPLVLRHFSTTITSYEQIARACSIPVGTVRSRLSQGRAKLAEALTATASAEHGDAGALTRRSWAEAHETLATAERGEFGTVLAERWSPDVVFLNDSVRVGGRELLLRAMDLDLSSGVRQRPVHVTAGRSLAVWEMDLINPKDDPEHCPPAVAWIMSIADGRVERLSLYHPRPVSPLVMASAQIIDPL